MESKRFQLGKKTHAEEKYEEGVRVCIPGFGVVGVFCSVFFSWFCGVLFYDLMNGCISGGGSGVVMTMSLFCVERDDSEREKEDRRRRSLGYQSTVLLRAFFLSLILSPLIWLYRPMESAMSILALLVLRIRLWMK